MCVNGWRDILILLSSSRKSSDDVPLRIRGKDDAVIRGILTEEVRQMRMFHELTFQTKNGHSERSARNFNYSSVFSSTFLLLLRLLFLLLLRLLLFLFFSSLIPSGMGRSAFLERSYLPCLMSMTFAVVMSPTLR